MTPPPTTRREVILAAASVGTALGVTGCVGGNDGGDGTLYEAGESHSFAGEGMDETEMFELDQGFMAVEFQSDAEDILTAHLVNIEVETDGNLIDDRLLLNWPAPLEGSLANIVSGGTYLIDVDVDGPWSFDIEQPAIHEDDVDELPFERSGTEPKYFGPVELPETALIHAEHSGGGGFTIDTITTDGHWDVPINESGEVDSTRSLRDEGIAWISVYGVDDWSFEVVPSE